ncbi:MAG: 4Fe-4S binding protein [Desulfomonilaceae bacterium]|nr:4Fe-4S binding protein [Desulfomonilaceae bacterium]
MYRTYRRAAQLLVFSVMFLIPLLNLYEIYAITGTFYAVNIGRLGIADPVVIFQALFASGSLTAALLSAALFAVFLALLLGRVWCGWMCPYHLLADGAAWTRARVRHKLFRSNAPESLVVPGSLKANMVRYAFLVLGTVAAGAFGIPFLNYVSAPGILSTEAMIFVKERSVSLELGFIAALLLLELCVSPRFWCRLFCPTGAFLALFRMPFTLRVGTDTAGPKAPCCKGNYCSAACPMGLSAFREGNNLLCTNCGRCIDACTAHGGPGRLHFKGFTS